MSARAVPPSQAWNLVLIQTKMTPPTPPRGRVNRLALQQRLVQALERRLTLVMAPAGFGKTTLLREWCDMLRARQHAVGWLSIDAEDDALEQFGAYLLACLRRGGGVGEHAEALLRNDPMTPVATIVSVLLNEIAACEEQVFLILDDFDRISSRAIRALVLRLLRYAPPNFHMLLGVRREPDLNLGELRAQGQLLRIGVDDLRFTIEDARVFFGQAAGVSLDPSSVEMLHDATEGWVAGLQLASLALGPSADAAQVARDITSNRCGIDAYLENTVLAQLTPAMRQFALRTSILERLGPEVCDALMGGGSNSWEKLEWLEQNNLFLRAVDEERRWYRYHALMAAALRRRAERSLAKELPALHRRASTWFAQHQLWPEAVRHALACGDMERAAVWVEDAAMALIGRSDVRTVLGWLAKLPPDIVHERLRLRIARIWAQTLSLQAREAAQAAASLEQEVQHLQAQATARMSDVSLMAEVSAVRALIAGLLDDSPRSLELGRLALQQASSSTPAWVRLFSEAAVVFGLIYAGRFEEVRQLSAAESVDVSDDVSLYADVYRTTMFGLSALVEGHSDDAARIFEAALSKAEGMVGRNSAAAVLPAGYLANIYYERNDLAHVQQLIEGRTAIALQACALGSLQRYCRASARLFARRGDIASGLTILDEGRELAGARQWLRLRASCDAEAVRLYLLRGEVDQAQRVVDELGAAMPASVPAPIGSFLETFASHVFARARLAMARGRPEQAAEILEDARARLHAGGMAYLEATASMLLALALDQRGYGPDALDALEDALAYAHVHGMLSSFIDEGPSMLSLLHAWRARAPCRLGDAVPLVEQLVKLLDASAAHETGTPSPTEAIASPLLSAREIEVLTHISRGMSNKEIARALQVAPETIKWHVKNIFEKLNVGSRIEAVQVGLGLLRLPNEERNEGTPGGSGPGSV